jgi:hypothetical protein
MRTNKLMFGLVIAGAAAGCQTSTGGPGARGATMREYAGSISVVFSNATPDTMCNLQMSFEDADKFGDNWLPAGGVPSGKSIEFKVEPGKYKATWNTCKNGDKPYYAATLTGELAMEIKEDAQLLAYIADTVAPTKRAALVDFHAMVKFQGQAIDPNPGRVQPVERVAPSTEAVAKEEAPVEPAKPTFDASYIDTPKAKGKTATKKKTVKPSLSREHDVTRQAVRMKSR